MGVWYLVWLGRVGIGGRGGWIRTSGFLIPGQALCQAELRPDFGVAVNVGLWKGVSRQPPGRRKEIPRPHTADRPDSYIRHGSEVT